MLKDILPFLELNGQFGKLTDRSKETPVPELVEGPLSKPHIYTVAYASGSERSVLIPCNSVLIRGKCLFFLAHPSLTHPALKDMLLFFLNLAFTKVYGNAHDELACLVLRIFSQNW